MRKDLGELYKQILSQSIIASEICRGKTVIASFFKDPDAYGMTTVPAGGVSSLPDGAHRTGHTPMGKGGRPKKILLAFW